MKIKKYFSKFCSKGGLFLFLRAQISSQAATWTDNGIAFALKKTLDIFKIKTLTFFSRGIESYVFATVVGQIFGGFILCILNYKFTFRTQNVKFKYILLKFCMVWVGSMFLNTYFTFLLTEWLKTQPLIVKIFVKNPDDIFIFVKLTVAIFVGFFWNYTLYYLFVYKDRKIDEFFKKILHIKNEKNLHI